ncbi:MAG: hypothetical protein WAM42_13675 [Candidatus Nitrosopolaris sp.]
MNNNGDAPGSPICPFLGELMCTAVDKIVKVKIEPKVVTLMIIVEAPTATTTVLQGVLR